MAIRGSFKVLEDDQIESVYSAVLQVLERVGLEVNSSKALNLLKDAGCDLNFQDHIVKIPTHLIEETVKKFPEEVVLHARKPEPDLHLKPENIYTRLSANCLTVIDYNTGKCRLATTKDQEDFIRLCDALPGVNIISPPFAVSDVHPRIRDVHGAECAFRLTRKHVHCTAYSNKNLDRILKMASIIAGSDEELRKKPIMSFFGCPEAALYFGEVADMIINAASKRLPVSILPTVIAGGTSPVTLAGTLVQSTAEFLAGALMVQLTSPGNPVIISTAPVNLNMKTGTPLLGTMEFGLMIAGVAQIAKYFKIPSNVYGFGSDSKTLDEQVAFEKAFLLTLSAMAGADIIYGPGVLESDVTNSYEQVIIDCELLENIQRLMKGIRVEEETLAVNIIAKVGPRGHYLKEEHTRRLFRQEYFIPHLADRTPRLVWEKAGSKDVVAKAREEVKRILAEHQPPQLPEVTVKELKDILHTVEKETLSFQ